MKFPVSCPSVPVESLPPALAYWRDRLGFSIRWANEGLGLAELWRGDTRLFLTDAAYREPMAINGPILLWINLESRAEVDALYAEWAAAGVETGGPPYVNPPKLYEFFASDQDGNHLRVFHDIGGVAEA
jgi:hypothetical protein